MKPKFLDYRFLDCNLTCNTCNPEFSSSWYKLVHKNNHSTGGAGFIRDEYLRVLKLYEWERLYFAGGEPLMQKDHLDHLKYLADKSGAKDLTIFYNTNLSLNQVFLKKWVELLSSFGSTLIFVSIDSYGRHNDIIRQGSSFIRVEKNIQCLIANKPSNVDVAIDLTITSVFFYNIFEFSEWILKNRLSLNVRVMVGTSYLGYFLRLEVLRIEFRRRVFAKWEAWYENLQKDDKNLLFNLYEVLRSHYNLAEMSEAEVKEIKKHLDRADSFGRNELLSFVYSEMKQDLCFELTSEKELTAVQLN